MKICFIGDMHWGARRDSITFQEYFNTFYEDVFFPYLIKNKIKKVIQFGDMFDNRKSTNTRTLRMIKDNLIDKLAELDIEMWIICGNHDLFHKYIMQPNSLREHLNHYDHIHVIDSPTTVKFGKCAIDLIPWVCPENQEEIFNFIKNTKSKISCGHFELSGFSMYRGIINQHGESSKFLKKYDNVYSGHYHTKSCGDNITYLGTPYELTWADCGDDKGFYEFDTLKMTTTFIQNPYKLHHKIMYNDITELVNIKQFDYANYKNSFIRIIIESRTNIPHFENFMESLWKNSTPLDISITDTSVAYRDIDIESIETQDPLTALITTIDNDQINTAGLNVREIKKMAADIYNLALVNVHEGNS